MVKLKIIDKTWQYISLYLLMIALDGYGRAIAFQSWFLKFLQEMFPWNLMRCLETNTGKYNQDLCKKLEHLRCIQCMKRQENKCHHNTLYFI